MVWPTLGSRTAKEQNRSTCDVLYEEWLKMSLCLDVVQKTPEAIPVY